MVVWNKTNIHTFYFENFNEPVLWQHSVIMTYKSIFTACFVIGEGVSVLNKVVLTTGTYFSNF